MTIIMIIIDTISNNIMIVMITSAAARFGFGFHPPCRLQDHEFPCTGLLIIILDDAVIIVPCGSNHNYFGNSRAQQ